MAVLPSSGNLSLKNAAGANRSIAGEVDGNITGNKSLKALSLAAGKGSPHGMKEFYNYDDGTTSVPANFGNDPTSSCNGGIMTSTAYHRSDQSWATGTIIYTDAARTTPSTSAFVTNGNTARVWSLNAGALDADIQECSIA